MRVSPTVRESPGSLGLGGSVGPPASARSPVWRRDLHMAWTTRRQDRQAEGVPSGPRYPPVGRQSLAGTATAPSLRLFPVYGNGIELPTNYHRAGWAPGDRTLDQVLDPGGGR